jgi:hypothetical protein
MSGMPPDDLPEWAREGGAPAPGRPAHGQQPGQPQFQQQPQPGQPQYAPQPGPPQQYAPQPGPPQQYAPQPGPPQQYAPQPGQPQQYAPQPGQPQQYAPQPGQPQQYAPQPGQPQQYAPQPGQPQQYAPQPGQPQQYAPGVYQHGSIPTAARPGGDPSWPTTVAAPPDPVAAAKPGDFELPPMPGGWYQPPTADDLASASIAPPVPLGTGAGLTGPPSFAQVLPGTDPLVSYDFSSWITKVVSALGRSWKGLLSVNTIGTIGSVLAGVAMFIGASKVVGIDKLVVDDPGGSATSVFIVLMATFTAYFFGTLVTQAASSYVLVKDAFEGKGRFRIGEAFGFGLRSLQRLAWGMFGSFLIYLAFAVGAGGILIAALMVLGSQGIGVVAIIVGVLYLPIIYLIVTIQTSLVGVAAFEEAPVIRRSLSRIKGSWWTMFVRQLVIRFSGITNFIQIRSTDKAAKVGLNLFGLGVTFLAMMVTLSVQAAAQLVSYAELRSHSDGGGITPILSKEAW